MSETMYMKKIVSSEELANSTKASNDKLEDVEFASYSTNNARTKLQKSLDDGDSYLTDLGATINANKKLTLRDLGMHMTQRMLKSMSQEKVNEFRTINLGSPAADTAHSSPVNNILKNMFQSSGKNEWISSSSQGGGGNGTYDVLYYMKTRYGDYVSDIADYNDYAKKSAGIMMGEANVLNPPFQFNELDDVRSDYRRPKIGRLYSEEIYDYNMPIMYMQPGTVTVNVAGIQAVSKIANMQSQNLQKYLRDDSSIFKWARTKVGNILNSIVSTGARYFLDTAKWYSWTPNIFRYMRFVNEILIELAGWMGVLDEPYTTDEIETSADKIKELNSDSSITNIEKLMDKAKSIYGDGSTEASQDEQTKTEFDYYAVGNDKPINYESHEGYMGGYGEDGSTQILSILRILPQFRRSAKILNTKRDGRKEFASGDVDTAQNGWPVAMLTIPFAIDKGANSSESFTNSTQEHPLKEQYNQQYEATNQALMTGTGVQDLGSAAQQAINEWSVAGVLGTIGEFGKNYAVQAGENLAAGFGMTGEAGMMAAGAGRFVLPEVWSDSSFDKSYSISMKLRSPYGHRLSIFENEMVPLSFLIGLTAPRKIGIQSYTNPFYVRIYSKGLFSVPMGMITSLSITRGEDSNDRTIEGFFRTTSISISIKDMLPGVCMSLDGGIFGVSHATNEGMFNYLCTLCGIDFIERANLAEMFHKNVEKLKNSFRRNFDFFGWAGTNGDTAKSNLQMLLFQGSTLGKFISTQAIEAGKSQNPFETRIPTNFY